MKENNNSDIQSGTTKIKAQEKSEIELKKI